MYRFEEVSVHRRKLCYHVILEYDVNIRVTPVKEERCAGASIVGSSAVIF